MSRAKTAPSRPKPIIELGDTDLKLLAAAIVDALVVLIQHKCGGSTVVSRGDIVRVLEAAADLGSFVRR